jgi:hypothetical protein
LTIFIFFNISTIKKDFFIQVYPSIARLAKKYFSTNSTLTGAEQISKQFAPLASSLSFNFKSGELISRMIRLHSIYKNNTSLKPPRRKKNLIIFEKNFNKNKLKKNEEEKIKKRVKFEEEEEEEEIEQVIEKNNKEDNNNNTFYNKKKIIKINGEDEEISLKGQ